MKYDPAFHHRRSIRLRGYDYSQAGAYFVTACTHNREALLAAEAVQRAVVSAWRALPERFPSVALDEFVIMPNHVHGIVILTTDGAVQGAASRAPAGRHRAAEEGAASRAPTGRPTLGDVVLAFKSVSAIAANGMLHRTGLPFWQRNYYEHVVRDEDELKRVRQYIQENPLHWDDDPDNPLNL